MPKAHARRCNNNHLQRGWGGGSISELWSSFSLHGTYNEMCVVIAMKGWELDNGRRLYHDAMKDEMFET